MRESFTSVEIGTISPRSERTHKPLDVFGRRAQIALRLRVDPVRAPEAIEVVHVEAAHEGLQRLEDLVDADAERLGLGAIEIDEDLRGDGTEGGEEIARAPASRDCGR